MVLTAWAAVVAAPAGTDTRVPFTQFGVSGTFVLRTSTDPALRESAYAQLRDLGARWLRVDVHWNAIEGTRGVYRWAQLDQVVGDAQRHGVKVLALVQRTPAWARPPKTAPTHPPISTTGLQAYQRFLQVPAQRYTRPGATRVHAVEVWNEPNVPDSWTGGQILSRYVALLQRTWTAVKAVNTKTVVVTGGLAPANDTSTSTNPRTWLKRLYAAGGRRWFNAVGMHPYTFPNLASEGGVYGWGNMTRPSAGRPSMRTTMEANGDGGKKIWVTEYGAPVAEVGEARQAAIIVDAVDTWVRYSWAGTFFVFSLHDVPNGPTNGRTMGLLRNDDTRRPAFGALEQMIVWAADPTATTTTTTASTSSTTTESTTTTDSTTTTESTTTTTTESTTTTTTEPTTTTDSTTTTEP